MLSFEWDNKKNLSNYRKHRIWFEEAQTIWADANAIEFYDSEHSESEDRFIRIGSSTTINLLLVVFCERKQGTAIRIISARKATRNERDQYEEGI